MNNRQALLTKNIQAIVTNKLGAMFNNSIECVRKVGELDKLNVPLHVIDFQGN